jgi:hypothetical protein
VGDTTAQVELMLSRVVEAATPQAEIMLSQVVVNVIKPQIVMM